MDERYWDPQLETLPVERRRQLQDHRLRWQVRRCWDGSPFYRARLEAAGIDPATFGGLDDLARLPILRPEDLPTGPDPDTARAVWAVAPRAWWLRREPADGTTARIQTDGDVIQHAHQAARATWASGIRLGRSLGAMADASPGRTAVGMPGIAKVVAYSCLEGEGNHWSDDYFLIEVINPATGMIAATGEHGALVVTDLAREGSPMVRFWTGWEGNLFDEPCSCGRTSIRSTVIRPLTRG